MGLISQPVFAKHIAARDRMALEPIVAYQPQSLSREAVERPLRPETLLRAEGRPSGLVNPSAQLVEA